MTLMRCLTPVRYTLTATLLCVACPFVLADSTQDDQDSLPLEEIVVIASKYQSRVRDIAADVSTLTDKQLNDTFSASLVDVFRYVPGIAHESSGSRFGSEGVVIRGIGGNRVAIEVDGVPLSDQFDIGNFSNAGRDFIDPGFVGRVEVLRGPASSLYGSSALGGVVAIETPDPARLVSNGNFGGQFSGFPCLQRDQNRTQPRKVSSVETGGVPLRFQHPSSHVPCAPA